MTAMNTTMNVELVETAGSGRNSRWFVNVNGAPLRTKYLKSRAFRSEAAARKEMVRLLGACDCNFIVRPL